MVNVNLLNVIILNVVILTVFLLSVVAPCRCGILFRQGGTIDFLRFQVLPKFSHLYFMTKIKFQAKNRGAILKATHDNLKIILNVWVS